MEKQKAYTEMQEFRRSYIRNRCERINRRASEIELELLAIDIDFDTKTELENEQDELKQEKAQLQMAWRKIEEALPEYKKCREVIELARKRMNQLEKENGDLGQLLLKESLK